MSDSKKDPGAGRLNMGDPILVPTCIDIAGRTFEIGETDASISQVVLNALYQAFEEIDELKERIATIEAAPAVQNDV